MFDSFLKENYKTEIIKLLTDHDLTYRSLFVEFSKLVEFSPEFGNEFIRDAEKKLQELYVALDQVENEIVGEIADKCSGKKRITIRISGFPNYPELHRRIFPKSKDLNMFLQISGTVVRTTPMKIFEFRKQFKCSTCKQITIVNADYSQYLSILPPKKCSQTANTCNGKTMRPEIQLNYKNCKDYQEIKLQEQVSKLNIGSVPSAIWVTLEDDLVDVCKPGDDVTISGSVLRRWKPPIQGKPLESEIFFKANNVHVNSDKKSSIVLNHKWDDHFKGFWEKHRETLFTARNVIVASICPQVFGMFIVKLALAVTLAGGARAGRAAEDDTSSDRLRTRQEPHLLLIGDPGTGKSQILKFAAKLVPRSVLTTGVGSTSAGLTCAAVMVGAAICTACKENDSRVWKDGFMGSQKYRGIISIENGDWQLEGGALVLSDGGICCIDEFNSMKEHDRASIHEAMEQQSISVAKASIVCKLSTRCSVIAAANAKGKLDLSQPMTLNIAMASPLLSRFDLIFVLQDRTNREWDKLVSDYILNRRPKQEPVGGNETATSWDADTLQAYFGYIKRLNPVLTPASNAILKSYYQAQRQAPMRNAARTTVRLLDSLVRLSQAHARIMLRSEVVVADAITAVFLVECSMEGAALCLPPDVVNVYSNSPQWPELWQQKITKIILEKLDLQDILKAENISDSVSSRILETQCPIFDQQIAFTGPDEVVNIPTVYQKKPAASAHVHSDPTGLNLAKLKQKTPKKKNKSVPSPQKAVKRRKAGQETETDLINALPSVVESVHCFTDEELNLDESFELFPAKKEESLKLGFREQLKGFKFQSRKSKNTVEENETVVLPDAPLSQASASTLFQSQDYNVDDLDLVVD